MKGKLLQAINEVCWLLLITFYTTDELSCLEICIYLVFCEVSDSSLSCYVLIFSNGNLNVPCGEISALFFETELSVERTSTVTTEYQLRRLDFLEGLEISMSEDKPLSINIKTERSCEGENN
jgi:hypothetical protein